MDNLSVVVETRPGLSPESIEARAAAKQLQHEIKVFVGSSVRWSSSPKAAWSAARARPSGWWICASAELARRCQRGWPSQRASSPASPTPSLTACVVSGQVIGQRSRRLSRATRAVSWLR